MTRGGSRPRSEEDSAQKLQRAGERGRAPHQWDLQEEELGGKGRVTGLCRGAQSTAAPVMPAWAPAPSATLSRAPLDRMISEAQATSSPSLPEQLVLFTGLTCAHTVLSACRGSLRPILTASASPGAITACRVAITPLESGRYSASLTTRKHRPCNQKGPDAACFRPFLTLPLLESGPPGAPQGRISASS